MSGDRKPPVVRARVVVPLALLLAAGLASYLLLGRSGPFGPLRPAPGTDWEPQSSDEVAVWAWQSGMAAYDSGAFEDASVFLGRSSGPHETHPAPLFYAGVSHLMCDRPHVAEGLLVRAVERAPDEPLYRYYLAWSIHLQERDEEAITLLRKAAAGEGRWAERANRALAGLGD